MSKELQALEKLCDVALCDCSTNELNRIANYKNIIETALKKLEQTQIILGAEKIEDLPNLATTIDNELYSTSYKLKRNEKKIKALETIKNKRVNLEYLKCCETYEQYKTICSYWNEISQEEFDLLKEELL